MPPLDVCALRLANQHLTRQKLEKPSDIVRLFGAVQAQDYSGAKWGLAQRTRGATDIAVEKEISDGAILRTHVLRPTWHFVSPADIRWMLALTAPRVKAVLASYDRKLELDDVVLRRSRAVLTKALRDGKQLTRLELARALTKGGVRADGTQRLARLMMHAELDGLICSGARRGKQFTYALLDERAPPAKTVERDAALSELANRYFMTRGPASIDDFAWWSGLTKADARRGVQAGESGLKHAVIGKRGYWFPPGRPTKAKSPVVRLLPIYDEYFIGLKDRTAMLTQVETTTSTRFNSLSGHVLTIDGQIVGVWKRAFEGMSVIVQLKPFKRLREAEHRAIVREVDRFAAFLELPVRLELNVSRP
jgi:hypothetical protein